MVGDLVVVADHIHHPKIDKVKYFWWQVFGCCDLDVCIYGFEGETCSKINYFYRRYNLFLKIEANKDILRFEVTMDQANLFEKAEAEEYSANYFFELPTVVFFEDSKCSLILNDIVYALALVEGALGFEEDFA